nr:DUF5979 domain-containing protein [uncultured Anaerostipes sp.]
MTKVWDDGDDVDSRPSEITFTATLLRGGTYGSWNQEIDFEMVPATITLRAENNWTYRTKEYWGYILDSAEETTPVPGYRYAGEYIPPNTCGVVELTNKKDETPPVPKSGNLTVSKKVEGNAGDKNKEFTFTVTLDDTSVNGTYDDMKFVNGVAIFTLKHGESVTAKDLPANIGYKVVESDNEGYTVEKSGDAGTIPESGTATAPFKNIKNEASPVPKSGNLTVSKKVEGNAGDKNKEFTFTVTLDDTSVNGTYDDMKFVNGVAIFTLKHGESVTAKDLPANIGYKVVESDNEGYTVEKSGDAGTIPESGTATAPFKNIKNEASPVPKSGNLTVSKKVEGNAGDKNKEFTFTVTLDDTSVNGTYDDMKFVNGVAIFTLKHGESVTAKDLPANIGYKVVESDNEGYTVKKSGDTGSIPEGETAVSRFINNKDRSTDDSVHKSDKPTSAPGKPSAPTNGTPETGDETNLALWLILIGVSCVGIISALIISGNRRKRAGHNK